MIESLERRALLTAETLTFNSFQTSGGGDTNLGYSINDSGFIIASLGANPLYSRYSSNPWHSTQGTTVFNNTVNGLTRIARTDGGNFRLSTIQLNSLNSFAPSTVPFTGTLSAGGTSTFNLNTDNNWNSFQTFSSPLSSNLTQLQWQQISNAGDFHQFDNIAVVIGPKISSFSPVSPNPRLTAVAAINVALTDAADLGSFTFADLTLTRNGSPIVLNSSIAISLLTGTTYQISGLTALTNLEGTYQLTLNARTILGAGTGLDGSGSGSVTWTNTSPPTVVATSPTLTGGTLAAGTTSLQVTFSSPTAFALGSSQRPAGSASQILTANPTASSGIYWFDTDGVGPNAPFQAYADMTTAGGGWMLAVNSVLGSEPASNRPDANAGTVGLSTAHTRNFNDYLGGSLQIRHQIDANNRGQGTFDAFYTGPYNAALPSGFAGFTNITTTNQGLLNAQYGQPFGANAFGAAWYGNAFSAIPSTPSGGFSGGPAINNNPAQVINSYRIWIRNSAASGGSQNGGADTASNYQLRSQGADGLLGNADDTIVPLGVSYTGTTATLSFPSLTDGVYRLTVKDSITNETGTAIDGDANSTAGGNWVRDFVVGALSTSLTSPNGFAFDPEFGGFGAGQLVQGPGNAFDGLNRLQIGGTGFSANASSTVNVSESSANVSQTQISSSFANLNGLSTTITTSGANPVRLSSAFNLYVSPSSNWANVEVRFVVDGTPLPVAATILTHQLFSGNSQVIPVVVEDYVTLAAGLRTITIQARQLNDPVNGGAPSSFPIFVDDGATASIRAIEFLAAGSIAESFANVPQVPISSSFANLNGLSTTITTSAANPVRLSSAFNLYVSSSSNWANVEIRFVVDGTPLPVAATIVTPPLSSGNSVIPVVVEDYVTLAAGLRTITVQARQINDPAAGGAPSNFPIFVDDGATASIRAIEFLAAGSIAESFANVPQVPISSSFANLNGLSTTITTRAANPVRLSSAFNLITLATSNWANVEVRFVVDGTPLPVAATILTPPLSSGNSQVIPVVVEDYVTLAAGLRTITIQARQINDPAAGGAPSSFPILVDDGATASIRAIEFLAQPLSTDGGRTVSTNSQTISGVDVQREVTVPSVGLGDFSRTVDTFTNATGAAISTPVRMVGNLGSDAATIVFATSDGDLIVEPTDLWFGTDDGDGTGTPAIIHLLHGPFGLQPTSVNVIDDNVEWTYNLTVPAGETKRLASFTVLGTTRAEAIASANTLVTNSGFGGQAAAFLTPQELASLANFQFNSAPTNIAITNGSIAENSGANGVVGTLSFTDPNPGDTATFILPGGFSSNDLFNIAPDGITLRANNSFNFEMQNSYSITVRVTDAGGLSFDKQFTISVTDVNEAPTAVSLQNVVSTLPENTSTVSAIKVADILVTDDALGTNGLTVTGPDAAFFEISGTQLFLKSGTTLNFEGKPTFSITVQVDDPTVGSTPDLTVPYSLTLTDVNEAPTAVNLQNVVSTLPENASTSSRIKVADILVTDDALGTNTLSLSGGDAAAFEIVGTQLFLKAGTSLDFETQPVFNVTVSVDDSTVGLTPDAQVGHTLELSNVTEFSSLLVQDGQTQRSYVRYLDVVFDQSEGVQAMINSGRFKLTKYDFLGNNPTNVPLTSSVFSLNRNIARVDFGAQGVGGNRNTNAGDGHYVLEVDTNNDSLFESSAAFHRLLGDLTGDGQVDNSDKSQMLRRSGPLAENDVNGDGLLNLSDTSLLTRAFGRRIWLYFRT